VITLDEILANPEHPLHALNSAYQTYVQKARKAHVYLAGRVSPEALATYYQGTLERYKAEKTKALASGLHLTFIPRQGDPRWGYYVLDEEAGETEGTCRDDG